MSHASPHALFSRDDTRYNVNSLTGPVDLVVGIPSFNESDSIGFVAEQAALGLQEYGNLRTAVVNADNFSRDGTRDAFLEADTGEIHKSYLSTPPGVRGKGNNFWNFFQYALAHDARAVVVVDADLRSIRPDWISSLADPVLAGADFVAPVYRRNEYDGTITNHICYPLLYGLLGVGIRQPIGGEFGFSRRLMQHWLEQDWTPAIREYGVDIFMTTEAILGGFRTAQVRLGAKVHKPSAPRLGPMFTQVVHTLFRQLKRCRHRWGRDSVQIPPTSGEEFSSQPQPLGVDYKEIKRQALEQHARTNGIVRRILPDDLRALLDEQFERRRFRIGSSVWARTVYGFLQGFTAAASAEEELQIVEALKSYYFARVASFFRQTLELEHDESEQRLRAQAKTFRRQRRQAVSG